MSENQSVKRGSIWFKVSKNGKKYMSIKFDDQDFVAFMAKKATDKSPDAYIFESKRDDSPYSPTGGKPVRYHNEPKEPEETSGSDSELPF